MAKFKVTLYFDGNKNPSGCSCSYKLTCGTLVKEQTVKLPDETTVPQAEYFGLIRGLAACKKSEDIDIEIFGDSQLIVRQVNREWECKNTRLRELRSEVNTLLSKFASWKATWVRREENKVG
jgi:ribonuclease HI